MKKKFWNKDDSGSDKIMKLCNISGCLILFLLFFFAVGVFAKQRVEKGGWFSSDKTPITLEDERTTFKQRYEVSAIEGRKAEVELSLVVAFDDENKTIDIGTFTFDYIPSTIYFDPRDSGFDSATVIYGLPQKWFLDKVKDKANYIIVDKRKQIVRGDPLFYIKEDYPESLLVDEIEIHVDAIKIYKYEGYNETAYNFVISTTETSEEFNIVDFYIKGNNLLKGVKP